MNVPALNRITLHQYALPLCKALPGGDGRLLREGLILQASLSNGNSVYSEAAPLPNFSEDSIEEAKLDLLTFLSGLQTLPTDLDMGWLRTITRDIRCASARFAVEVLILKYWGLLNDRNWPYALHPSFNRSVKVNGLLEGKEEEWLRSLQRMLESGISTIKVKLGKQTVFRTLEHLIELSRHTSPAVRWRFDANGAWSLPDALEICRAMASLPVDYLEEPLEDISAWNALAADTTVPLALDETLARLEHSDLKRFDGLDTIVLKPTILGGVIASMDWQEAATAAGLRSTFTSAFETWIGLQDIAALQSACGIDTASGLGTLDWFHYHPTLAPYDAVIGGEIMLSGWYRKQNLIDQHLMTPVESWLK